MNCFLFSGGSRISRRGGPRGLVGGAWTLEAVTFLKILYVKTKESGPLGGACAGHASLDPPMLLKEQFNKTVPVRRPLAVDSFTHLIGIKLQCECLLFKDHGSADQAPITLN